MKSCPKCNIQLEDYTQFCPVCGAGTPIFQRSPQQHSQIQPQLSKKQMKIELKQQRRIEKERFKEQKRIEKMEKRLIKNQKRMSESQDINSQNNQNVKPTGNIQQQNIPVQSQPNPPKPIMGQNINIRNKSSDEEKGIRSSPQSDGFNNKEVKEKKMDEPQNCFTCGKQLIYDNQMKRFYCTKCRKYL